MNVLHDGLADTKYRPCPLLTKYVEAGWLGPKQRGFMIIAGNPSSDPIGSSGSNRFRAALHKSARVTGPFFDFITINRCTNDWGLRLIHCDHNFRINNPCRKVAEIWFAIDKAEFAPGKNTGTTVALDRWIISQ